MLLFVECSTFAVCVFVFRLLFVWLLKLALLDRRATRKSASRAFKRLRDTFCSSKSRKLNIQICFDSSLQLLLPLQECFVLPHAKSRSNFAEISETKKQKSVKTAIFHCPAVGGRRRKRNERRQFERNLIQFSHKQLRLFAARQHSTGDATSDKPTRSQNQSTKPQNVCAKFASCGLLSRANSNSKRNCKSNLLFINVSSAFCVVSSFIIFRLILRLIVCCLLRVWRKLEPHNIKRRAAYQCGAVLLQ